VRSLRLRLQIAILAGGVLGALARAGLDRLIPLRPGTWPWATFTANVAGTILLAYLATRLQERLPPSTFRRPLLATGFCGALTTFSTLQVELVRLVRDGDAALAVAYLAATLAVGLVAAYGVTVATRRVPAR
jgi:CrcB protein